MPLALADRLTELLDRAAYVYRWPLYHPLPETWSPERPRCRKAPDWMDAERRLNEPLHPDRVRTTPRQLVRLGFDRLAVLNQRLAHLEAHGRTPSVCLYAINPLRERSAYLFAAARTYADSQGWRVGVERCIADRLSTTDPMCAGWRWGLHLIRTRHADGVVAPRRSDISQHLDDYDFQLDLLDRHGGFVALVTPETTRDEAVKPQVVTVPARTGRVPDDEAGRVAGQIDATCRTFPHTVRVGGPR